MKKKRVYKALSRHPERREILRYAQDDMTPLNEHALKRQQRRRPAACPRDPSILLHSRTLQISRKAAALPLIKFKSLTLAFSLLSSLLTSCSLAPPYQTPAMPIHTNYKEAGKWVAVHPTIEVVTRHDAWWESFHDKTLTELERKLTCNNQNIQIALARYQEACALAQAARSAFYPTILGLGNAIRQGTSTNAANSSKIDIPQPTYNTFLFGANLSYEIDAWGRVRNAVAASEHLAQASSFDLAAVNLSMRAELVSDYFAWRGDEAAQRILDETVKAYQRAAYLTRQRFEGGASPEIDLDQANTQLESAKTLAADIRLKSAQLQHAIAVLVGEIPANFTMPAAKSPMKVVTIAPSLPSTLLERRPDVAAQEQRVQAANARIGVARAAFFPTFTFSSFVGMESDKLRNLLTSPSLFWSLGPIAAVSLFQPEVSQVIFDGYQLQALLGKAKADYFEAASTYRQTVLTAFQEVEDNLVALRRLDEERKTQAAAMIAAKRAWFQANQRYVGGIATFLDVVVTENQALQSELAFITIRTRRQLASVQLIKALGGGWSECCKKTA